MNPSYSFKDNILVKNNKYLKFLDTSNGSHNIIGLDTNNNLQIKSLNDSGNIVINNGSDSHEISTRSTVINSKLGIGTSVLNYLINLPKNNVIGISDPDSSGYLGLAGSNSMSSGSSIILNGESSSSGNLILNSESGDIRVATQNLPRLQVNNIGTLLFTPDGSTPVISVQNETTNILNNLIIDNTINASSSGTAALSVKGGAYFDKDIYVNGVLYTENLATFKTLQSDLLSSAQLQITDTTNAINRSDGGSFTVAGGAAVNKNLIIGDNLLFNTNAFSYAGSFIHTTDAFIPTELEGLLFDPVYVRSFTIELTFRVQLSTNSKVYKYLKINGIQSSESGTGWNITSQSVGGDTINYSMSHQIVDGKVQLFYTSPGIANFQAVSVNYITNGTTNVQDTITLPSTINPTTYNLSTGIAGGVLHYDTTGREVVTSNVSVTSGKLVLTDTSLEVDGDINFTGNLLENGEPFIGSQWIGDIGQTVSYTSGGVIVDSVTTGSLNVTGDINFTGSFLENGEPFVGSQWNGDIGETISYTSGGVVVDALTTGSLQVDGDINFTGNFLENGEPFVGSQWTGAIGDTISYTSGGVVTDSLTSGRLNVSNNTFVISQKMEPRQFPPIGLTSANFTVSNQTYGNGEYIITASSEYQAPEQAWNAFDNSDTTTTWTISGGMYNSSTGAYEGVTSTTIDGNSYAGEWLQIKLPYPIILTKYDIFPRGASLNRSPKTFYIAGSNDGSLWSMIDQKSNITNYTTAGKTFNVDNVSSTAFSYYRIVVNSNYGDEFRFLSIGSWKLYKEDDFIDYISGGIYVEEGRQEQINFIQNAQLQAMFGNVNIYGETTLSNLYFQRDQTGYGALKFKFIYPSLTNVTVSISAQTGYIYGGYYGTPIMKLVKNNSETLDQVSLSTSNTTYTLTETSSFELNNTFSITFENAGFMELNLNNFSITLSVDIPTIQKAGIYVGYNGSIGIRNENPNYALDVDGDVYMSETLQIEKELYVQGDTNVTGNIGITGNINYLGTLLKNNVPFVESQWSTLSNDQLSYKKGKVITDEFQAGKIITSTIDVLNIFRIFYGPDISTFVTNLGNYTLFATSYFQADGSSSIMGNSGFPYLKYIGNQTLTFIFKWVSEVIFNGSYTINLRSSTGALKSTLKTISIPTYSNNYTFSFPATFDNGDYLELFGDSSNPRMEGVKITAQIQPTQTPALIIDDIGNIGIRKYSSDDVSLDINGDMRVLRSESLELIQTPLSTGLVGYYTGASWNGTQWTDLSGLNNHVTNVSGTVSTGTESGIAFIQGNTSTKLFFPNGILPTNYTLFHVAKYIGSSNRQRIFTSTISGVANWLSGFWQNKNGVAFHEGGFITQESVSQHGLNNWVFSTDQNALYRSQGVDRTIKTGSALNAPLTINGASGELSDWAVAEVIVYNRLLSEKEILLIEKYLFNKYQGFTSSYIGGDVPITASGVLMPVLQAYSTGITTGSVQVDGNLRCGGKIFQTDDVSSLILGAEYGFTFLYTNALTTYNIVGYKESGTGYGPITLYNGVMSIFSNSGLFNTSVSDTITYTGTDTIQLNLNWQFRLYNVPSPIRIKFVKINSLNDSTDVIAESSYSGGYHRIIGAFYMSTNDKFQMWVDATSANVDILTGPEENSPDGIAYTIYKPDPHNINGLTGETNAIRYQSKSDHVFFTSNSTTSSLERMRILGLNGNIGINTSNPEYTLDVNGTFDASNSAGSILLASSGNVGINTSNPAYTLDVNGTFEATGSSGSIVLASSGNVGIGLTNPSSKLHVQGDIYASGDIIAFSDAKLKTDIITITKALEKVNSLRGVYFTSLQSNKRSVGLIAQELQSILPEVVSTGGEYLGVAYGNIVGLLIEAIKEQSGILEEQSGILKEQSGILEELRSEINELKLREL